MRLLIRRRSSWTARAPFRRTGTAWLGVIAACLGIGLTTQPAAAQPAAEDTPAAVTPAGDSGRNVDDLITYSATGVALPNYPIPADLALQSLRANAWGVDGTQYVLLDTDVSIGIGAYKFRSERAAAIITDRVMMGEKVRHVGLYLDNVREIGGTAIAQEAPRLLVTAVLTGKIQIQTDDMSPESKASDPLMVAATGRLNRYLASIAQNTVPMPGGPRLYDRERFVERAVRRSEITGEAPKLPPEVADLVPPEMIQRPVVGPDGQPILSPKKTAQVDFNAGRIIGKNKEGYVLLIGDIQVLYADPNTGRQLSLEADKAVIFLAQDEASEGEGDAPVGRSLDAGRIEGVYLEDNVIASDGQYTLRGPRMFYDLKQSKAIVLEAVFFTWDVQRQIPLYVRADELRQHSQRQWSAQNAKLSTSEFAEPHFSIGVSKLTIDADPKAQGIADHRVKAEDITLNAGSVPLFYWPEITGSATETPLQSVSVGAGSRRGATIETRWDMFSLFNLRKPAGVNASLLVNGYSQRGPALGTAIDYDVDNAFGELDAIYLYDTDEDEPGGREEIDPDSRHRGRFLWRHRHYLPDNWEASVELAWLSDETYLEEWYPDQANAEKEYETSIYLKQQRDDWAFTFLAKYDLLDFVAQNDVLQTRGSFAAGVAEFGYTTNKFPEVGYNRIATPLWDDRLTWYSENRGSVMQLNIPRDSPGDRGFTLAESFALFALFPSERFHEGFAGSGVSTYGIIDDDIRYRFDSRQEIVAPLKLGPVNVTPYLVGRVTAYDSDFEAFGGDDFTPGNSDSIRLYGAAGVRLHTTFYQDIYGIENDWFDVHGLRQIIEPSVNLFFAGTTMDQSDLPVYDYDVESLVEGGFVQFGLRQTFQTRRGGSGNWRTVDMIRIETKAVLATDEPDFESPFARFYDYRPEHSLVGDHISNEIAWQVTDSLAFVSNLNYSIEFDRLVRQTLGITFDHTPRLTSFVSYRRIDFFDYFDDNSSIIRWGFDYKLTPKYHASFAHGYDLSRGRNRHVTLTLTRRLPRWLLIMTFDVDTIESITSAGIALVPEGLGGSGSPTRNPFLIR